jgi:hypothetical protein
MTHEEANLQDWLQRGSIEFLGITRQVYEKHRKALAKEFGFEPSPNDVRWRILNSMVGATRDYNDLKFIYLELGHIASEEGKDTTPYITEALRCELLAIKANMGDWTYRIHIHTSNDHLVCSACREAAEKSYSIEEALEHMPIPSLCQSEHGCRCTYSAKLVLEDE